MTFNPSAGQWGNEVGNSARPTVHLLTGNPTTGYDTTQLGRAIGYARGVLRLECGRTEVKVNANPGPWSYESKAATAIRDLKAWFQYLGEPGITVNNVLDAKAYELLDVCVAFG